MLRAQVAGETRVEEAEALSFRDVLAIQAGRATGLRMELRSLRVVRQPPKTERRLPGRPRRRMHRGLLRLRVTCGRMTSVVPGVRMGRPLCKRHGTKIRVSLLVEAARWCGTMTALLLTLLGV